MDDSAPVPAPKRTRKRRSPSEIFVETVMRMPLGEMVKFADSIVARDIETARFLYGRLGSALKE